jgi:hypothetical protein
VILVQHKQKGCVCIITSNFNLFQNSFEIGGIDVAAADNNDKPTFKFFDWLKITEATWMGADLLPVHTYRYGTTFSSL